MENHVPRSKFSEFFQLTLFICDNYNNNSSHTLITLPQIDLIIVRIFLVYMTKGFIILLLLLKLKCKKAFHFGVIINGLSNFVTMFCDVRR